MIKKLNKKILKLTLMVVAGVVLVASAGWSDPLVDIFFDPSSGNFNQGATFEVKIMISSNNAVNNIAAIDAAVFYDTRYLEYQGYVDKLGNWSAAKVTNEVKGNNGTFYFSKFSDDDTDYDINLSPSSPYHLYSLIFKVVSPAGLTATLNFDSDPNDAGGDDLNIVDRDSQSDIVRNIGSAAYTIEANQSPTAPTLISPENGTKEVSLTPTFVWSESTDPDEDKVSYHLQVAENGDFNSPVIDQAGIASTSIDSPTRLNPDKIYYWKVKAIDDLGSSSEWSAVSTFETLKSPTIEDISWKAGTDEGYVYGTLIVTGSNFGWPAAGEGDTNNYNVTINDLMIPDTDSNSLSAEVWSWSNTTIEAGVPLSVEGTYLVAGSLPVKVTAKRMESNSYSFTLKPRIYSLKPASGKTGDLVTLEGTAYGTNRSNVQVYFDNKSASISSANNTLLMVTVPDGLDLGEATVKVKVNEKESNEEKFTVVSAPDTTPPYISSTTPSDKSSNVALDQRISIIFSEAMDTSSVSLGANSDPAGWSAYWNSDNKTVTYAHNNFDYNTTYTLTVTSAKDLVGNDLTGVNYFSFTTLVAPLPGELSVSFNQPEPYAHGYTSPSPQLSWSAKAENGIYGYNLFIDGSSEPIYSGTKESYQLSSLAEKNHLLKIEVIDGTDKVATTEQTIYVDASAPTISGSYPTVSKDTVTFKFTLDDVRSGVSSCEVKIYDNNGNVKASNAQSYNTEEKIVNPVEYTSSFSGLAIGAYSYDLIPKDKVGNNATISGTLYAGSFESVNLSASSTSTSIGETINLSASTSGLTESDTSINYQWSSTGGTVSGSGNAATFSSHRAGTYTLTVMVSAFAGNISATKSIALTMNPIITGITLTADQTLVSPEALVTLRAVVIGQENLGESIDVTSQFAGQITWEVSGGKISSSFSSANFSASEDGLYTVTAKIGDQSAVVEIKINGEAPKISVKSGDQELTAGLILSTNPKLTIEISDNNGVKEDSIKIKIDEENLDSSNLTINAYASKGESIVTNYVVTLNGNLSLPVGIHSLSVSASDNDGKESTITISNLQVYSGVSLIGIPMNYPNPFKPAGGESTTLKYTLTADGEIKILLFDLTGRQVWSNIYSAGSEGGKADVNRVSFKGINTFGEVLGNGVYHYFLINEGKVIGRGQIAVLD